MGATTPACLAPSETTATAGTGHSIAPEAALSPARNAKRSIPCRFHAARRCFSCREWFCAEESPAPAGASQPDDRRPRIQRRGRARDSTGVCSRVRSDSMTS
jgi:hypothetical protein